MCHRPTIDTILDMEIPPGWRLNSVDASIQGRFRVMLVRNAAGLAAWHNLDEMDQEFVEIYTNSVRNTFEDALDDACRQAYAADRLP